jgi:hypothetical protein
MSELQIAILITERDGFRVTARTLKADNKALTERNAELEKQVEDVNIWRYKAFLAYPNLDLDIESQEGE